MVVGKLCIQPMLYYDEEGSREGPGAAESSTCHYWVVVTGRAMLQKDVVSRRRGHTVKDTAMLFIVSIKIFTQPVSRRTGGDTSPSSHSLRGDFVL